jgi:hypothetical protein
VCATLPFRPLRLIRHQRPERAASSESRGNTATAAAMKKHTQMSITKLRDKKQVVSQPIHKSDIIQGEVVIYLDDTSTEHLTLLVISKSHILLV